jgi:DNA replication licensing factor MCM2
MADNPHGGRRGGRPNDESDSEAHEDNIIDDISGDSEGSGEDLDANEEEDYRAIPELDHYEEEGLDDDSELEELEPDSRR